MYRIRGINVPQAYEEFLWTFLGAASTEESRNGPVWTIPDISILEVDRPEQRVLFDAQRDANPFFHVMEFVWMMSGTEDISFILQFNKQMAEYSDDGSTLPQAYGHRWRKYFGYDQIRWCIDALKRDKQDRRAVLGMWDSYVDFAPSKDRPCNTNIFFRVDAGGSLNMLVCNRSNDAIWGMFGANCVHMTFLQELIAQSIGLRVGTYRVVTNNLHVYKSLPNVDMILRKPGGTQNYYRTMDLQTYPLLEKDETYSHFVEDCETFVRFPNSQLFATRWMRNVALPIKQAYLGDKEERARIVTQVAAQDWRVACTRWLERKHERTHNS